QRTGKEKAARIMKTQAAFPLVYHQRRSSASQPVPPVQYTKHFHVAKGPIFFLTFIAKLLYDN
ncbi:MAG: hypothetical protein KC643_31885, partial [Nitrospira sp.]|nr:hypothetical protein [Nitrospira sp.]